MSDELFVADLCGRHIGRRLTLWIDPDQITGKLTAVNHGNYADKAFIGLSVGKVTMSFVAPWSTFVALFTDDDSAATKDGETK